jgi:hypothetical protein
LFSSAVTPRAGRRLGTPVLPPPAFVCRGRIRSRIEGGGTWCRLELFDWGVRLRGSALMKPFVPVFELRYGELAEARLVAARINRGIRLQAGCLPNAVIFVTAQGAEIADRLEERGVPVNRDVGRLGWLRGD